METAVRAPFAGRVREVLAAAELPGRRRRRAAEPRAGRRRRRGGLRRAGRAARRPTCGRATPRDRALSLLAALQALITGYDVSGGYAQQLVAEYGTRPRRAAGRRRRAAARRADRAHHVRRPGRALAQPPVQRARRRPTSRSTARASTSTPTCTRSTWSARGCRRASAAGCPGRCCTTASRDLEPSPALRGGRAPAVPGPAAHRRPAARRPGAARPLADADPAPAGRARRWPTCSTGSSSPPSCAIRPWATWPARCATATSRSRWSGRTGEVVLEEAGRLLAELETAGVSGRRRRGASRRIEALVASPEPLIRLLAQRVERPTTPARPDRGDADPALLPQPHLQNVRSALLAGHVRRVRRLRAQRHSGCTCCAGWSASTTCRRRWPSAGAAVGRRARPASTLLRRPLRLLAGPARRRRRAGGAAARHARRRWRRCTAMRRVTVTVCTPDGDVDTVTFRPSPGRAGRGPDHPRHAPADRAAAQPLAAEELRRRAAAVGRGHLPASTSYAKGNPNDERFIAMAEVRDLAPLLDEDGEIVGYPTVERQLTACLDSLRRAQSRRRSRRPLEHNRVFLYAWPSIEMPLSEVAVLRPRRSRR